MKISRYSEPSGLIFTHLGSRHTYGEAIEALNEMIETTRDSSEIYEIVIHEDDIKPDVSDDQIEDLKERLRSAYKAYKRGAIAFVANIDMIFHACRQLEQTMDNPSIAISVFRSEKLAKQWIREIKSIHDNEQ